jgi:hypothetical protein
MTEFLEGWSHVLNTQSSAAAIGEDWRHDPVLSQASSRGDLDVAFLIGRLDQFTEGRVLKL